MNNSKMLIKRFSILFRRGLRRCLSTLPSTETVTPTEHSNKTEEELHYEKVLQHPDYFQVNNLFTVKKLFDAKVHYGHKITSLNNKMKPFIFGSRLDHLIFDLDQTAFHLREALNFAAHIAFRDGIILFVSRNPRMTLTVNKTALACEEFVISREWRRGALTDSGEEVRLPDLVIFFNTLEVNGSEHPGIVEAAKMCIPTIGIVDTNCDPNLVTYPIPGNDDSPSSVELYCKLFKAAILRGKNERKKLFKEKRKNDKTIATDKLMEEDTSDESTSSEEEVEAAKIFEEELEITKLLENQEAEVTGSLKTEEPKKD